MNDKSVEVRSSVSVIVTDDSLSLGGDAVTIETVIEGKHGNTVRKVWDKISARINEAAEELENE